MYDLCVDTSEEVVQVDDELLFEKIRAPSTRFVMRVALTQEVQRKDIMKKEIFNTYTCPRCKMETRVKQKSNTSIDWYDFYVVN